jgi:hypothetical protein
VEYVCAISDRMLVTVEWTLSNPRKQETPFRSPSRIIMVKWASVTLDIENSDMICGTALAYPWHPK